MRLCESQPNKEDIVCIKGLISIIIPVYNVRNYLNRCIKSVINQSYPYIEIILVDDGSDDGSSEMCDAWAEKEERVRVFHKGNGGTSSARNLGLEEAEGEFIGFVDGDDYIKEDMYDALLSDMDDEVDITCCGTIGISPVRKNKRIGGYGIAPRKIYFSKTEAIESLLLQQYISFSPCDKLYRSVLFDNIRFPVGRTCEDLPVIYELMKESRSVVNIGTAKYFYYYRKESMSRRDFYYRRVDFALFAGEICIDVKKNYPQFAMQAEALYVEYVVHTIKSIQCCNNRLRYKGIEKRLRKVLKHMCIRILNNECIPKEKKQLYLLKCFI